MDNKDTWEVPRCEAITLDEAEAQELGFSTAIRADYSVASKVAGLPEGFVTYPLLSKDFSQDSEVMDFINKVGVVGCPYASAPARARSMLLGLGTPYPSPSAMHVGDGGKEGESALFPLLSGIGRMLTGRNRVDASASFDGQWAPKDMLYAALHASPVADYLYINKLGFIARYFDDECLLGSERLRARALLHGADGAGNPGSCLLFAFEEVRLTLYILQVAAVVMQGRSYLEHEQAETIKHGKRVEKARERFTPTDIEEMEADLEKKSPENKGAYRRLISRTVTGDSEYHDVFRLFGLFFQGRQNLLKAVKAIASGAISDMDSNFSDPYGGAPHLNADEEERIGAIERRALAGGADPSLLSMRPYVPLWLQMEDDLTLFLESCITCDWFPLPSELIGTDVLKRGSFADGGKDFSEAKFMWPFQRAIASQLVEYLRYAEKSRQNRATPGSVEQVANKESWQLCEWCGEPFLFKNATPSLIKSSVAKNTRHRLPTSPYCCDAHRMSVSRSK